MADPDATHERPASPGMPQQQQHHSFAATLEAAPPLDSEQQLQHHPNQSQVNEPVPPPFQPLFTLITDSITRTTRHPQVHYIFSDDDPQLLTDALADHAYEHLPPSSHDSSPNASTSHNLRKAPLAKPNTERAILLDLVPKPAFHPDDDPTASSATATGFHVQQASSLSADWAVTSARITLMADDAATVPSDTQGSEAADGAPRLMLRIEGVDVASGVPAATTRTRKASTSTVAQISSAAAGGRRPSLEEREMRMSASGGGAGGKRASPSGGPGAAQGNEDYGAICEEFDKRMGMLRKVIDASLERQQYITTAASTEQQPPAPHGNDRDDGHSGVDRPKPR